MTDIVAELTRLNEAFATAELTTDVGFFRTHLADGLQFRRAGGTVVDKAQYLRDLGAPENTNEKVEAREIHVLCYGADLAVCSLLVDFKGIRGGTPTESVVRNTRVFIRSAGSWKCALWVNTNDQQPARKPSTFAGTARS